MISDLDSVRWYKSKVDWWLVPLLALPPTVSVVILVQMLLVGDFWGILISVGVLAFVGSLYGVVIFPIRYGIDPAGLLLVRSGMYCKRIELSEIQAVVPTRNPLSSPALSLQRLRIEFGPRFFDAVMISPKNRDEFLQDLAETAGMQRTGETLTR